MSRNCSFRDYSRRGLVKGAAGLGLASVVPAHHAHLHGHQFKQIARKPDGPREPYWRDTILLNPDDEFTMAFVAGKPGKWMLHSHMLEHQEGGMMTWFAVTA